MAKVICSHRLICPHAVCAHRSPHLAECCEYQHEEQCEFRGVECDPKCEPTIRALFSNRGSLIVDRKITGMTQSMNEEQKRFFYGGHYLAEGMTWVAAASICEALGWEMVDDLDEWERSS